VEEYKTLRDEIDRLVGRLNGDLGRIGRPVISYLHSSFPREELAAFYRAADIMVVTPYRDGQNLVAKEYVACRLGGDGALVLSEFAGAAEELRQAWEYYHTPRCEHPNAPGFMTARSLSQILSYDAFHKAEAFLTQPLLVIAGSEAGSKWMSDDLHQRAASTDKSFHIVEGANHMELYDGEKEVAEAVSKLGPFFTDRL